MSVPPASRIARQHLLDALAAVVFDDEAGVGGDVGFEVGVDAPGVAGDDLDPGVVETPGERPAFDKEVNLEARQQDFVERSDDQLILTDGENAHVSRPARTAPARQGVHAKPRLYACASMTCTGSRLCSDGMVRRCGRADAFAQTRAAVRGVLVLSVIPGQVVLHAGPSTGSDSGAA